MVPETHGLSSPVGDSWESTHPCNDHLELESKNKISKKKGYLIVVGSQVGNQLEVLTGYPIVVGAQVGKPGGYSICLRVLDGGLRGRCLDGV